MRLLPAPSAGRKVTSARLGRAGMRLRWVSSANRAGRKPRLRAEVALELAHEREVVVVAWLQLVGIQNEVENPVGIQVEVPDQGLERAQDVRGAALAQGILACHAEKMENICTGQTTAQACMSLMFFLKINVYVLSKYKLAPSYKLNYKNNEAAHMELYLCYAS